MKNRFTLILTLTSALCLFGLSAKAQTGPTIGGSVYGGGKGSTARVTGAVLVEVKAGTVGTTSPALGIGDVYGGGQQANVVGSTTVNLKGGTVYGDVYGGGALANVTENTSVTTSGGSTRMVFGGGMGNDSNEALVDGNTAVSIEGGTVNGNTINTSETVKGGIYGGCNVKGTVKGGATVDITATVGANNNHVNIYGGGLGENTNVQGSVDVTVNAGSNIIYGDVYGGSAKGLVNYTYGSTTEPYDGDDVATVVTLTSGTVTGDLYGGGHGLDGISANVGREVRVAVNGGTVKTYGDANEYGGNVFGCNNAKGAPQDTVGVVVSGTALVMGDVYGGGNLAAYEADTVGVTISGGTVNGRVFGGGNNISIANKGVRGSLVEMTGGLVEGGIYGGCNENGVVEKSTVVNVIGGTVGMATIQANDTTVGVYGGGLGPDTKVLKNVTVTVSRASGNNAPDAPTIYGDVYGGSGFGNVNSVAADKTTVNILDGAIRQRTKTVGTVTKYYGGNVYGGGLGQKLVQDNPATIEVNEYQPAYEAKEFGEVTVNIGSAAASSTQGSDQQYLTYSGNATIEGSVYGCNNTNGSPQDNVTVNVYQTAHTEKDLASYLEDDRTYAIDNVFGGGNEANYTPAIANKKASVNIFSCDNTIRRTFGGGNAANVGTEGTGVIKADVATDILGGRFAEVYGGGNGERGENYAANIYGNVALGIHGGDVGMFFVGSNQHGTIEGNSTVGVDESGCGSIQVDEFFCGGNYADFEGDINATISCSQGMHVTNLYGGCNQANVVPGNPGTTGSIHLKVYGGEFENVYGGSKGTLSTPANIAGNVTLDIFGGTIDTVFGGSNINGNIFGKITVNIFDLEHDPCGLTVHNVYGGGRDAAYTPTTPGAYPEVNVIHGAVSKKAITDPDTHITTYWGGKVFGGGYGEKATVSSNPKVRIGYDATMTGLPTTISTGYASVPSPKTVVVDSLVFGGGDMAAVAGSTEVIIQKANVENASSSALGLFGGGNKASVGNATVGVLGGNVTAGVYGGCNEEGTVGGEIITLFVNTANNNSVDTVATTPYYPGTIAVNLNGGTVGVDGTTTDVVFGGGYGQNTFTKGNIGVTLNGTNVYGNLYGGSALGSVNAGTGNTTTVTLTSSTLHGSVFGGGMGSGSEEATKATSLGNATVNIDVANPDGYLTGIYGGANVNGNVAGNINVNVKANVGATGDGNSRDIFGGGLGAATTTGGDVTVTIGKDNTTPIIHGDVYGGSALGAVGNSDGQDTTKVDFKNGTLNGRIYGGGMGQTGSTNIEAMVNGDVVVDVTDGSITDGVYGGCNERGTVTGDITVNANGGTIGTSHTARANVHGGGLGNATATTGDVEVNINGATVYGDIYGGSGFGNVNATGDTTTVNILDGTIYGDIYGGGLGDRAVSGDPTHHDYAALVNGKVFVNIGSDENHGNATISTYTVGDNPFGGNVFGCNNANGSPQDSVFVNIYHTAHTTTPINNTYPSEPNGGWTVAALAINSANQKYAIQAVYGGGNEAAYTPPFADGKPRSATVHVYGCNTNTIEDVYGGGNAANVGTSEVYTDTYVIIDGGRINRVFGGGKGVAASGGTGGVAANINGRATTTVYAGLIDTIFGGSNQNGSINTINLVLANESGSSCEDKLYNQVFGGANVAEITGNLNTTINCGVGTIGDIYGGSNLANITGGVTLNIRGGTYNNVFGGSRGGPDENEGADISGNVVLNLEGGTMTNAFGGSNVQGNIGGSITVNVEETSTCSLVVDTIYGGGQDAAYSPTSASVSPVVNLKKGTVGHGTVPGCVFGGGKGLSATVTANPKVVIGDLDNAYEVAVTGNVYGGGNLAKVAGNTEITIQENDGEGASTTISHNVYGGGNKADVLGSVTVNVNGGTVTEDVYGGGALAHVNVTNDALTPGATTSVTLSGATVRDLYGGGLGRREATNVTPIAAKVYGPVTVTVNSGTVHDVFGCNNENGAPQSTVQVNINNNVSHNVYGGGNLAVYLGTPDVNIYDGTVTGSVFGGGNQAGVGGGDVEMTDGNVLGGLYGGCNTSGEVGGNITVNVTGGTVGTDDTNNDDGVFGGGYGSGTSTTGDVTVEIGGGEVFGDVYGGSAKGNVNNASDDKTTVTLSGGAIHGDLYGGGLGDADHAALVKGAVQVNVEDGTVINVFGCNNVNGAPQSTVQVDINNSVSGSVFGGGNLAQYSGNPVVNINHGTVGGNVFGGGKGVLASGADRGQKGKVTGVPQVTVGDDVAEHTVQVTGDVYGGGDAAHVVGVPVVVVKDCNTTIGYLYGGGNAADVNGTNVTVHAVGNITEAYGGGHGDKTIIEEPFKYADVNGNVVFKVHGGTISKVFAGSNSKGSITGTSKLTVNKTGTCSMKIEEVYGGGNEADGNAGTIEIGCTGDLVSLTSGQHYGIDQEGIRYVYGGANKANIGTSLNPSNITLNITSGIIENVFGGNNDSGTISGSITVNIEKNNSSSCPDDWYVGNVYGGGNHAAYSGTPDVNIQNGTVSGSVYGGGNEADVGGGDVAMTGGTVLGGIYGGCNSSGVVDGNITVTITNGTIGADETHRADVFGGGYGDGTSSTGDVTVNFGGTPESFPSDHNEFPKIFGDIYGGSALGSVNDDDSDKTAVNILNGTLVTYQTSSSGGFPVYNGGNVFGGGLGLAGDATKGKVNGTVTVNIGTGTLSGSYTTETSGEAIIKGNVYGCNNTNGSPQQNVTVNIYHTAHTPDDSATYVGTTPSELKYALQNVFGGGNRADFRVSGKTATVNIYGCDNTIGRTFGGGNAAATNNVSTMIQGGRINNAFAGGNGEVSAANVYGNATLAIHGGDIGMSFNGSNQNGQISGTSSVTIDDEGCGEVQVNEHFCGNNFSDYYGDIVAEIECPGMHVKNLYGGCKQAKVLKYPTKSEIEANLSSFPDDLIELYHEHESTWDTEYAGKGGNIHLTVTGGVYENIYGGSQGKIDPSNSENNISADIAGHILLEIHGGTVSNAVYGGSHILGRVGGTITVNIEDKYPNDGCPLDLSIADIYGGGNMADYTTPNVSGYPQTHDFPHVNIKNATVKNVFGGGLAAEVKGNPQIRIKKGAKVLGNVYGGGNMGVMDGNPRVIINGKDDSDNPTGDDVLDPGYVLPDLP